MLSVKVSNFRISFCSFDLSCSIPEKQNKKVNCVDICIVYCLVLLIK